MPPKIADLLGEEVSLVGMRPEYNVGFGDEGGIGGPVRCDVFARVKVDGLTCALVIEAKVDERFGEKLGEWRRGEEGIRIQPPIENLVWKRYARSWDWMSLRTAVCDTSFFPRHLLQCKWPRN